jgi:hypothetical protein
MATKPEPGRTKTRQIVGFSLKPELAEAVKSEAKSRRIPLQTLLEEMWALYKAKRPNG